MDNNKKDNNEDLFKDVHKDSELDTSKGDFTTIALAIVLTLVIVAVLPLFTNVRLGDFSPVITYTGFLLLVIIFWFIIEKIKHRKDKKR